MSFDPDTQPHRRYNPLSGRWVLVSPPRAQRPWQRQPEPLGDGEDEMLAEPQRDLTPEQAAARLRALADEVSGFSRKTS